MANAKVTKLVEKGESPKAYRFVQLDRDDNEGPEFWLPKSQIDRLSRFDGAITSIEIPTWLADEKGLDYYEK